MSKCKLCECTDLHACKGGCFWVDKRSTICSTCAINKKVLFVNKENDSKAIITEAFFCNLDTLAVTVKYQNGSKYSYYLKVFMDMFTVIES